MINISRCNKCSVRECKIFSSLSDKSSFDSRICRNYKEPQRLKTSLLKNAFYSSKRSRNFIIKVLDNVNLKIENYN